MLDAFGDRLFAVSRALGFDNNSAFAREIGVLPQEVQRLFVVLAQPSVSKVRCIAENLGIPESVLRRGVRSTDEAERPGLPAEIAALIPSTGRSTKGQSLQPEGISLTVPATPGTDEPSVRGSEADLLEGLGDRGKLTLRGIQYAAGKFPQQAAELYDQIDELVAQFLNAPPKARRHSGGKR